MVANVIEHVNVVANIEHDNAVGEVDVVVDAAVVGPGPILALIENLDLIRDDLLTRMKALGLISPQQTCCIIKCGWSKDKRTRDGGVIRARTPLDKKCVQFPGQVFAGEHYKQRTLSSADTYVALNHQ